MWLTDSACGGKSARKLEKPEPRMTDRILFVDDDSNLLQAYKRGLRRQFHIDTSLGGEQGLEAVATQGPYAVIISDLRMPGMDGIQFLSRVREAAPDSVRMMLTGCADVENAIQAVNEGNVFRFLTKPCQPDILAKALAAGLKQYRLVMAERELLEKTLRGSIKVLMEVLGLLNPEAFGRAQRITRYVREIAAEMGIAEVWQLETAAMLSQIGCIILPEEILEKTYKGEVLNMEESRLFMRHPHVAADLLANIPRMQGISEIIAYQEKYFDGGGTPEDARIGEAIPLGARVLKPVLDFDTLEASGTRKSEALTRLKQKRGWYDPRVLTALEAILELDERRYELKDVTVKELRDNMILAEHVRTLKGITLVVKGHQIGQAMIERLRNVARNSRIKEPIRVLVPLTETTDMHQVKRQTEGEIIHDSQSAIR
jgi:response regulator RpfG family c-di-GMP phosphodiesterase